MARKRRRRKKDSVAGDLFGRMIRAVIAIAVLTAFVLAIAYGVKTLSSVDSKDLAGFASPFLAKVGIKEEQIGEVAGSVFEMIGDLDIEGMTSSSEEPKDEDKEETVEEEKKVTSEKLSPEGEVVTTFAVIADSHIANDKQDYKDNKDHLRRALAQAGELNVERAIHVGDVTNWGVLADLREAKTILDESELDYSVLPGDRDLAQAIGPENFIKVFGDANDTFKAGNQKVVLFDNSANYTVISDKEMEWFKKEVQDADIVILSQPIFTDGLVLFNYLYMGSTDDVENETSLADKQAAVHAQRDELLEAVRESNVKLVIAGDHHKSSFLTDPERGSLEHHVVGATSGTVGAASQSILQAQRFTKVSIYENGAYELEDIILDIVQN